MSIRVALNHRTEYRYQRPVMLSPQVVRLRPAPHCRTHILSYSLKVEPALHFINWQQDPFSNYLARLVFADRTDRFILQVDLIADMTVINPFDFFVDESARKFPFRYEPQLAHDLAPYLEVAERGPLLAQWLAGVDRRAQDTIDFLVALNRRIYRDVAYTIRMEAGVQGCDETLSRAVGSCRDSAWLQVQVLRHLGLAARFASGYIVQLAPDIKSLDGPSGPERDFTDLHAWAEAYVPGAGWIGLDATSGLLAGEGHIPLACTPDPQSASPVTGLVEPCETEFRFHNTVERIHEDPRVTRPYTEAQWQAIDALGEQVDSELQRGRVRLTMGGEPTFVSIDDMGGDEWKTVADSPAKRKLAGGLLLRLAERFASGPLLHYGQGKWYPGEPLPRWALSCYWRRDGKPVWHRGELLKHDDDAPGYGVEHAQRLLLAIAQRLGLPAARVREAYEDPWPHLLEEARDPVNVDPLASDLSDPQMRRQLLRLLDGELNQVAGYVLPLRRNPSPRARLRWQTHPWPLRRERLFLLPGSSPLGLRLPLASLPWEAPEEREPPTDADPFEPRRALRNKWPRIAVAADPCAADADVVIPTALCVQARDGRLHVFLPPLPRLEDFLELVAAVEDAAADSGLNVVLEGYTPPADPRLNALQITPDPGVLEVNVHPTANWRELQHVTETLYEEARLARLGTEKFMLDGRHTGTGGGNHVTLGGPEPRHSPLLRRPALLASLITYWQHHPALSYLFSGAFIGPTSQAPRVDEARDDNLHELEIALQLLPTGDSQQPWLVDRLLRNLMVDVTGNTHRAEFCIDKLYPPDKAAGRRGLLECRAFEMPPHPRMSLVQMLLLRTLVARFWTRPYRGRLARWGTELHDRFMLPHFIGVDLKQVVDDLNQAGYAFDLSWFLPFIEFRFPRYGTISVDAVELEIRAALEPWHVLGEEVGATGTARYVDSSVERIQVKVAGLVPQRHAVTCNGRRVPLRPTGVRGEYVGGVRFKAWQPPSGLHPTLPVHTPLVFDLVDINAGRALGGCTYHVGHPGGRNYETFPVNANEADARRMARFWPYGHTPGPVPLPPEEPSPDFPCTLDLRHGTVP